MRKRDRLDKPEANPTPDPIHERRDRLDNSDLVEGSEGGGTTGLSNPERERKRLIKGRSRWNKRRVS